ncbi:MAG: ABC transporter ATP-binding protein [Planctomycetaceae bacterium]|nr:ABC transporter ATP-binding protein [Planctomycetaceae bacterium]MBT6157226.1 ABC transporter ATP-binding protein [Planctomycetaceae bacterium]MBT6485944.1 ABC transporter ATP-binding protein [Planctomycetaceae bacterium]MBT6493770.1 ABC transporter ATP-binding protein [Planctomycetaceae bacterium]
MMIDVQHLQVKKNRRTICSIRQLAIQPGERVVVIGSNGSGKSTLLRVLAGLERDYEGRCDVRLTWRERTYVHQSPCLFRGTVLSSVAYGLRCRGVSQQVAAKRAQECLEQLGIHELATSNTQQLSGGETRRVALARALAFKPQLLILDEPLAELDAQGIESVCRVLTELSETTIVIASPTSMPTKISAREYQLDAPQAE